MKILSFTVCLGLALVVSCQPKQEKDPLIIEIENLEKELQDDVSIDTALAYQITSAYIAYADKNPEDSLSPYYLIRAADILKELRLEWLKSINVYNRVHHDYPDHPMAAKAVFMIGFVFDEKYGDSDRAIRSYEHFLKTYPNHTLVNDAKNLLALLKDTTGGDVDKVHRWLQQKENDTIKN